MMLTQLVKIYYYSSFSCLNFIQETMHNFFCYFVMTFNFRLSMIYNYFYFLYIYLLLSAINQSVNTKYQYEMYYFQY